MSEIHRVGDLDIGQDLNYQKRSWAIQRIGWVVMALLILLGLLGIFGSGVASTAGVGEKNSALSIEYDRFIRVQSQVTLVVRLGAGVENVRLSREYLDAVRIESISPTPETVETAPDYETYIFNRAASEAEKPLTVTFYVQPKSSGIISGQIFAGETARELRQYVYP